MILRNNIRLLFPIFFIYLFFSTYSPNRDDSLSYVGFLALSVLVGVSSIFWTAKGARLYVNPFVVLVLIGVYVRLVSILMTVSATSNAGVRGAINNILIQLLVIFAAYLLTVSFSGSISPTKLVRIFARFLVSWGLFSGIVALQVLITQKGLFGPLGFSLNYPSLRFVGWYSSSNYFVDAIAVAFLSSVHLTIDGRKRKTGTGPKFVVLSILFLFFMIGSGSRGGILACFLALSIQVMGKNSVRMTAKQVIVVFIILLFTFILVSTNSINTNGDPLLKSLIDGLRLNRISTAASTRAGFWKTAIEMWQNGNFYEVLFGLGNGFFQQNTGTAIHNSYLEILVEQGIISFTYLVVFIPMAVFYSTKCCFVSNARVGHKVGFLLSIFAYPLFRGVFQSGSILSGGLVWSASIFSLIFIGFINKGNYEARPLSKLGAQ